MLRFYGEPALLLAPGLLALVLGFFVPVGQVFLYSVFVEAEGGRALGLDHFGRFFVDAYYLGVAGRTFRLSAIITLFCLLLGFPLAYLMARVSPRLRLWLIVLTILPMMTSVVIRTFGWLVLLGRGGLVADFLQAVGLVGPTFALLYTETGLVIAMVQVLLPFMALTLLVVISRIDPTLDEAARCLGGNFYQTLRHVVFPLSLPGVVSGSLLCFALSISSFITPTLVGGLRLPVLAMSIYQQAFSTLDWSFAAAQSVMLFAAVLFLMMPYTVLMGGLVVVRGVPLTAKLIAAALIVIIVCFMLVPQIVVVGTSLSRGEYLSFPPVGLSLRWYKWILGSELYLEAAWTSLRVAVTVTVIAVLVGTPAAIALTRFRFPGVDALGALFVSPLILPMIIIGIGLLMVFSALGAAPTFWALVLGHVVITLPYVVRTVSAVLVDIDPHIEEAARVMGANWLQRYWFVLLPQCRQGIAAGAFFAFNISFDDVVVVLFLRAPDLETLPLRIYSDLEFSPSPAIAAVSSIMMFITIALIVVIDRVLGLRRAVR